MFIELLKEDDMTITTELIKVKNINTNSKLNNILVNGDNFEYLKHLLKTHKEQVDVIYIDPPYNTGVKLKYADDLEHMDWLLFMAKRLKIAKSLLKEDGIIFISIDDRQHAYLKILCDNIFGESNFLSNIVWQNGVGSNTGTSVVTITEYILMYAKDKSKFKVNLQDKVEVYKNTDEYVLERGKHNLKKLDERYTKAHFSKALVYPIKVSEGVEIYPGGGFEPSNELWNWRWSKDKVEWGIANGFIEVKEIKGKYTVYFKNYEKVDNKGNKREASVPPKNLILSSFVTTASGTAELKEVLPDAYFEYPKSTKLIKYLINFHRNKNALVLDFFAGSGTTGHAVLDLNSEDGGKREFILCTNNENNICDEITYKRIEKVIEGYIKPNGEVVEGRDGNLKYYKFS